MLIPSCRRSKRSLVHSYIIMHHMNTKIIAITIYKLSLNVFIHWVFNAPHQSSSIGKVSSAWVWTQSSRETIIDHGLTSYDERVLDCLILNYQKTLNNNCDSSLGTSTFLHDSYTGATKCSVFHHVIFVPKFWIENSLAQNTYLEKFK